MDNRKADRKAARDGLTQTDRIRQLKQTDETWTLIVRRARVWIDPPDERPYRPSLLIVATTNMGKVMRSALLDAVPPEPRDVLDELAKAMLKPVLLSGGKRRPAVIETDDAALVVALLPHLAELGVRCVYGAVRPAMERLYSKLERQLTREAYEPGLLTLPGIGEPRVRRIFALAAEYYRRAPWRFLNDALPVEIRCPEASDPRFGVVMGSGGEVFGLAVYDTAEALAMMFDPMGSKQMFRRTSWLALIFEEPRAMSFDDLDAMEHHGWEVAGPLAYPVIGRTTPKGQLTTPTVADVLWLEGALAALLAYLPGGGRGKPKIPFKKTVSIATEDGPRQVYLKVPASHPDE